ncbi:Tetratricopeptide repeat-containing protein [Nitrosomonas aestuarii]|uniref:Tetratricopeptide repeat-containing protein n=1 Tax=Nitrosomonas aestuarii TaxID=52441 RepID=A0A1I3Z6E7_9PROT|nr:tetratricopeptide repeat protein [Nitrosomonas aestuarii]SFK39099.1 Tetratricopeptide repeat-containing protein [Nitrosomonas aestuarii]
MSRLRSLLSHSILISLGIVSPLCHSVMPGDDTEQTVGKVFAGVVHTGAGDVRIGLTLQQYEAGLKRREKEVEIRYIKAHVNDQRHLEAQLYAIQSQLQDTRQSYQTHIDDLRKRIAQLESIRTQVSDELLNQAQQALAGGNTQQVERLLHLMESQSAGVNHVTAAASYQRCQIARDEIRYREAFTLCQRAVQLVPDRIDYLSDLADLAYTLGEYKKTITYYEQVLDNSLKTYGKDHADVAISRNNLGTVWDALGEYQKAIGYYEQALASDIKTYGEHHPDVAVDRNNLGMAWFALGEYKKAIVYLEQALASDIKTYGEHHLQVATYYNNLAGAWHALGDYKKSHDYLDQALKIFEKVLGENHPNTSGVRANYQQLQSDIQGLEDESDVSK